MSSERLTPPPTASAERAAPALPHRVFSHFARRSLALNRSRTVVSIIGITLSCALITAIFTSAATLMQSLLNATIEHSGSWQIEVESMTDDALQELESDGRVAQLYERPYYGSALLPEECETWYYRYLNAQAWPTEEETQGLLPLPKLIEGRVPTTENEIVLPSSLKGRLESDCAWDSGETRTATGRDDAVPRMTWYDKLEIDSEIELAFGERLWLDPELNREHAALASETLYTDLQGDESQLGEWLGNVETPQRFRVVGFYEEDSVWMSTNGYLGFVCRDTTLPVRSTDAFMSTNLSDRTSIDELAIAYTKQTDQSQTGVIHDTIAERHETLLRYQLLSDDRAIWDTFYSLAAILSGVVMIASISLVYNSFAISISERTRQYGLLSSLGASRRQIRRTVFTEALILVCISIPLGLLTGLIGTSVVFHIAGEGIEKLVGATLGVTNHTLNIAINPYVLGVAIVLTLFTVFISATVPAFRASRVSAVEAIRQTRDVHVVGKSHRDSKHAGQLETIDFMPRGFDRLRMRLLGVPDWLAHRNLTRARSKGSVAVASLAVSVSLLIASGSISHYMSYLVDVVDSNASDIVLHASVTPRGDNATQAFLSSIAAAYQDLSDIEGVTPRGYLFTVELYAKGTSGTFSTDDVTSEAARTVSDIPEQLLADDGSIYARTSLVFVDDESWESIVEDNGLDKTVYCDANHPVGIGQNDMPTNDGKRYGSRDPFDAPGTLEAYTHIATQDGCWFSGISLQDGKIMARYDQVADNDGDTTETNLPLNDVALDTYELPIGAILSNVPSCLGNHTFIWPTVILPASALPALAQGSAYEVASSFDTNSNAPFVFNKGSEDANAATLALTFSFDATNAHIAEEEMNRSISEGLNNDTWGVGWQRIDLINNAENARNSLLVYQTIQLFIGCFFLITGAIAISNVFTTLSSSIILRRREFAMLKSIGMSERAFHRMIAFECGSYAWRGLVGGLALGAIVTYFIWRAMCTSFYEIDYSLPLDWVIASFCVVVGVLALSTRYALRKSGHGSIIQTLREDVI